MCNCAYHKLINQKNIEYIQCHSFTNNICICQHWNGKIPKFHENALINTISGNKILYNMFKGPIIFLHDIDYLYMLNSRINEYINARHNNIYIDYKKYFENDLEFGCHILYYIQDQLFLNNVLN